MDQTVTSVPAYLLIGWGILGLAVGSFLTVVVYRVPRQLPVLHRRSACPGCSHEITLKDSVPVLSWLLRRGRCRQCQTTIPVRYPVMEILTGMLFMGTALRFGLSWTLPPELAFVAGLIALAACDLERYLLPKRIVYPTLMLTGLGLTLAAGVTGRWGRLATAAASGVIVALLLFAVHVVKPKWLGFGDVRLAGLLGVGLGWVAPADVLFGLIFANLAGTVVGVGLMATGRAKRDTPLPYGVFLAGGAIVALWCGASFVQWSGHSS
ncbi:MAG: prepilin peptidase [Actinomycetota bacterium]|nr:prepilin peptidase [Actinomycetota bacterium]